jgi:hypothetical protein
MIIQKNGPPAPGRKPDSSGFCKNNRPDTSIWSVSNTAPINQRD